MQSFREADVHLSTLKFVAERQVLSAGYGVPVPNQVVTGVSDTSVKQQVKTLATVRHVGPRTF